MITHTPPDDAIVRVKDVSLRYGKTPALNRISLEVPPSRMVGLIGPDGVGKSSLLSLISGARAMQEGELTVLGGDMRSKEHRNRVCPRIAYMPQGLGKNLYLTLTVEENLQFFARLFGHGAAERRRRIDHLTRSTGLYPFLDRPAGKLSGGMKQKLGLCCSLIHDPDLLILDEPTTGVDPLARRQFWDLIDSIRGEQPQMGVMVATAYMDEAQRFDHLIAMDAGKVLYAGTPASLLEKTQCDALDTAFIRLLPEEKRAAHKELSVPPLPEGSEEDIAIEAEGLTKSFGSFTAVDHVSFRIRRGEIFGFLGSNGCGKTTTMRMLTGLVPATSGKAWLFGRPVGKDTMKVRKQLGYMTQAFSLYGELSVRGNLLLYARLFGIGRDDVIPRVEEMLERFQLKEIADSYPGALPLGIKQRLSLAAAVIHRPQVLILDEPTSGVDPVARDNFWELIVELSRRDKVTIFITTHFMNEAERCDRISLMNAGKSLACDTPAALVKERVVDTLEAAFISYLEEAEAKDAPPPPPAETIKETLTGERKVEQKTLLNSLNKVFSLRRWYSCCWRETLELLRDPIRATLALFGAAVLMLVMGFGISLDVENLTFAVLDRDQTELSRNYALNISGSRYFVERPPILDYDDMDYRMRSGEVSMAIEFPPGFAKHVESGLEPGIGIWLDGAMPMRAETIDGYVKGMHAQWLLSQYTQKTGMEAPLHATVETRFRYNPDVLSLPAMVPAIIPILLMMIPAVLAALSVVREKEMGSIINLYVTPLTRAEFLLGKQLPYIMFSTFSFLLLLQMAVVIFHVPIKGSVLALLAALLIYCIISTGVGLIFSSITRSQIAVIFITMFGTLLPSTQYCGLLNPVATLEGVGRIIGMFYPTTYMLLISRGIFNKALGLSDLHLPFLMLVITVPVIMTLGIILQKKQAS